MDWKKIGKDVGLYVIALAVFLGLGYVTAKLFGMEIPTNNREPLMLVIGFLIAKAGTVVDYFFGSSSGSAAKTEALTNANSPTA